MSATMPLPTNTNAEQGEDDADHKDQCPLMERNEAWHNKGKDTDKEEHDNERDDAAADKHQCPHSSQDNWNDQNHVGEQSNKEHADVEE